MRRMPKIFLRLLSFLFFLISFSAIGASVETEEPLSVAFHIHSSVSSGKYSPAEISRLAREKKIDALILTDLLAESYSYGIAPFERFLQKTVRRKSVMDRGASAYLSEIQKAKEQTPEVLLIDGVVATPFYFWSGSIFPGPLVLNGRSKDLIVAGLPSAEDYEKIPVIQTGTSRFNAYRADPGAKPFQDVIDYALGRGGFVVWSHPLAEERRSVKLFLNRQVLLHSKSAEREVLQTQGYHAMGVYPVDLTLMINSPENQTPVSPGGLWDQVLSQHLGGRRKEPVWAVGESDYNGVPGENARLDAAVNHVYAGEKSREAVLSAMRAGKLYVTVSSGPAMKLDFFRAEDSASGQTVDMGGTLQVSAAPRIRARIVMPGNENGTYQLALIRNGKTIEILPLQSGASFEYTDTSLPETDSAFYRIAAFSDQGGSLISNPLFVRRPSA